jgi:hypothetical protein
VLHSVEIEVIEAKRRQLGIDDAELRDRVRRLAVGDRVNITLRAALASAGETVAVQITEIKGEHFRGTLVRRPASAGLTGLGAGLPVVFSAAHVHSVPRAQPAHDA